MNNRFKILAITLALVLTAGLVMAGDTPAAPAATAPQAAAPAKAPAKAPAHHMHGMLLSGTVSSVDNNAKTLVVKNAKGAETTVAWTDATTVKGGTLAAGQKVSVRWIKKDGKDVATAISISK